jgi:hypothetical protein
MYFTVLSSDYFRFLIVVEKFSKIGLLNPVEENQLKIEPLFLYPGFN